MKPHQVYGQGSGRAAWDAWGAKTYGSGWTATKDRYRRSRWTPRRCFWCLGLDGLQYNHLTYKLVRNHPTHGPGWTPLFTVLPLCERDHKIETALTRLFRRAFGRSGFEHLVVTLAGWLLLRGVPTVALFVGEAYAWGLTPWA